MDNSAEIIQSNPSPGVIDLGMGNPDNALLPMDALQRSADGFFQQGDVRSLQYGFEQGDVRFRRALAEFIGEAYGGAAVDPQSLFITAGASSGLDLVCTLFTQPGDTILVEEPSYFLALRIFADHGLRAVSVPTDDEGICLEPLEERMQAEKPKLVYIIPTYHNPSGRTLPQARRERLVEMAQRYNVRIIADEVYHFLPYGALPPRAMAQYASSAEQVISVNSFSKILAPGLRLGWILAHEHVVKALAGSGLLDSGGGLNPFASGLVRGMIESGGLAANLAVLKQVYSERMEAMSAALQQHLPQAEWNQPQGGFFFWVRLPGVDTGALRGLAQDYGVDIRQGALFSSENELGEYSRLCFSFYDAEAIREGVRRLGDCVREFAGTR